MRDFGKPISARNFGLVMTSLPSDRPLRTLIYVSQCEMRHSNSVLQPGFYSVESGMANFFQKKQTKQEN